MFNFGQLVHMMNWYAVVVVLVLAFVAFAFIKFGSLKKKPVMHQVESKVILEDATPTADVGSDVVEGEFKAVDAEPLDDKQSHPCKPGKYPALIMGKNIWRFGKIPDSLGHVFVCDTTMPEAGDHYLVKEIEPTGKNGWMYFEAFDPRVAPIVNNSTPEDAWFKTQDWEADVPYVDEGGILEKLPAIAAYCLIGLTCLAVLIYLGK